LYDSGGKAGDSPPFRRFSSAKMIFAILSGVLLVPLPSRSAPPGLRRFAAMAAAVWLAASGSAAAQTTGGGVTPDPTGEWMVANRRATIRIADCNGHLWGVVASQARASTDFRNPDPSLRARPTQGLPVLLNMTRTKYNLWEGKIYNSEDGHTYSASVSVINPNAVRVEGCFLGFLCGGENWSRVEPQDQPGVPPGLNTALPGRQQTTGGNPPNPADYVCSSVFGPAWLTHQRGLK
jgi:uncharacterized protein (DUF2147 family)